jgi:HEAT repeat protein
MVVAAVLSVCALAACRQSQRLTVERIAVADTPASSRLAAAGVTRAAIAGSATALFERAPGFAPAGEAGRGARRVRGQVFVHRADALAGAAGAAVVEVGLIVELASTDGGPALREEASAAEPIGIGPGGLRSALEGATRRALERAIAPRCRSCGAESTRAIRIRLLDAVRDHAIRVLADRGERHAVPPLIARLRDPDPEVSELALGALAQLRDERASLAIIDLAHHRDPAFTAQIARILGDIGGEDARAWLLTMSSGHPDIAVRNAAREALADLDAREPSAALAAPRP